MVLRSSWFAVVDAMFSTGPDDDGMREWVILSLLIFGLPAPHSPHHPPRPDRITASSVPFN